MNNIVPRLAWRNVKDDGMKKEVSRTALKIITSMKRDWMQEESPVAYVVAALYISALSHGAKCTKSDITLCGFSASVEVAAIRHLPSDNLPSDTLPSDNLPSDTLPLQDKGELDDTVIPHVDDLDLPIVIKIVHICDATLTKRLVEFENTESGSLTVTDLLYESRLLSLMEEFIVMADKVKGSNSSTERTDGSKNGLNTSGDEVLCVHKNDCKKPYALGLCKSCYDDFVELSGGLDGGSNPPAFQCAERVRTAKTMVEEGANDSSATGKLPRGLNPCNNTDKELDGAHADASKTVPSTEEAERKGAQRGLDDASDESENWSDIDDIEVDGYLHNEEEKHYKKIIWEEMNREYLEEQAAKDAAAAAAKNAYEANFQNCSADLKAAKDLADAAAAAVAKSRKERQRKRAAEAKNASPAQTAAEATRKMLNKKRLSSKINYDVLEKLFDESGGTEPLSKKKREEQTGQTDKAQNMTKEFESTEHKESELEQEDDYDGEGTYGSGLYYENMDEAQNYEQDYGYDEYD
ncbi:Transcription factor IIIB 90 kDa subunit, partial [Cucurbita argyrosperma subsp. sororia]